MDAASLPPTLPGTAGAAHETSGGATRAGSPVAGRTPGSGPEKATSLPDWAPAGMREYASGSPAPLDKALEQINEALAAWATGMKFDLDDEAQRLVVSIVDTSTGDTIRTIPSEAVLKVARMIVQLQGSGVDTHA